MKIAEVICQILRIPSVQAKTASSQDSVLVRIRTDTGLEGIGEADSSPEVVKAIIDAPFSHNIACGLRQILIGENPLEHERLWQKMYRRTMYFGRKAVGITAMAAIDVALWDLKGKPSVNPFINCSAASITIGFGAMPPFFSAGMVPRPATSPGAGRRQGIRPLSSAGNRWACRRKWISIWFGGTGGVGRCDVIDRCRMCLGCSNRASSGPRLRRISPEWFEEPLREDDIEGYVWLRDRSPIPIAAGEGECGRESFRPLIDRRALDVYQVDISRCGFTDASYIRSRVEEIGARLCNHCYTSPITVAASVHWLSTCRDAFVFEDCVEDSPLRHELTIEKIQSEQGWIEVPNRPGLGVTLNEDFVRHHLVAESR